jgi:hypothetical protein
VKHIFSPASEADISVSLAALRFKALKYKHNAQLRLPRVLVSHLAV